MRIIRSFCAATLLLLGSLTQVSSQESTQIQNCVRVGSVQLCDQQNEGIINDLYYDNTIHKCPDNYHICDSTDVNNFISLPYDRLPGCYATNIALFMDECNDCTNDDLKTNKMLTLGNECDNIKNRVSRNLQVDITCCTAMTAECEACKARMSIEEYCRQNPVMFGCEEFNSATEPSQSPAPSSDPRFPTDNTGEVPSISSSPKPSVSSSSIPKTSELPSREPEPEPSQSPVPSSDPRFPTDNTDEVPSISASPKPSASSSSIPKISVLPSRDPEPEPSQTPAPSQQTDQPQQCCTENSVICASCQLRISVLELCNTRPEFRDECIQRGIIRPTQTPRPSASSAPLSNNCCRENNVFCKACELQMSVVELCHTRADFRDECIQRGILPPETGVPSHNPTKLPTPTQDIDPIPSDDPRDNDFIEPSMTPRPSNMLRPEPSQPISPIPSQITKPSPSAIPRMRGCVVYGTRFVPVNWMGSINNCERCSCGYEGLICRNHCEQDEDNIQDIIDDIRSNSQEQRQPRTCFGIPYNVIQSVSKPTSGCLKTQEMNGVVCCPNKCSIPNCDVCENGKCKKCKKGYITIENRGNYYCVPQPQMPSQEPTPSTDRTNTTDETDEPGETQTEDMRTPTSSMEETYERLMPQLCSVNQTFSYFRGKVRCNDCNNGRVINNVCVCNQNYYGRYCELSCRRELCNGRGNCVMNTRRCVCDENWSGRHCEHFENPQDIEPLRCVYGVFMPEMNMCSCEYGFTGELCERRIKCANGEILDGECLCNDGWSGRDCSIRRPLPITKRMEVEERKQQLQSRSCRHGMMLDNVGCICADGWSGEKCDEYKCLHGMYNKTNDYCACNSGWSGEKCDINCKSPCSNKGSVCNDEQVCECVTGWGGERCERKQIIEREVAFNISSFTVDIQNNVQRDDVDIDVNIVECESERCIPVSLTLVPRIMNDTTIINSNITQRRVLASASSNTNENIVIVLDEEMVGQNNSLYVFVDTMPQYNYTFDSNVVNITDPVEGTYIINTIERKYATQIASSLMEVTVYNGTVSEIVDIVASPDPSVSADPSVVASPSSSPIPSASPSNGASISPTPTTTPSQSVVLDQALPTNEPKQSDKEMYLYIGIGGTLVAMGIVVSIGFISYTNRKKAQYKSKESKTVLHNNPLNSKV